MLNLAQEAGILDVLSDIGVRLTDKGVALLKENPTFKQEIEDGGWSDTCAREAIWDELAMVAVGRGWPTYSEGLSEEEIREFVKSVFAGLVASGLARPTDTSVKEN